jgi:hypothetical protein
VFDNEILGAFASKFFGYGNWNAPIWFVGMEEACGDVAGLKRRFAAWNERGRAALEDAREFHIAFGDDSRFVGARPSTQPTWRGLIKIMQAAEGKSIDIESCRLRQQHDWGRANGESCLLELLPLPSPDTLTWVYGRHSKLPYLKCRSVYTDQFLEVRTEKLKSLIAEHSPRAVVFYGRKYQKHWDAIAGGSFQLARESAFRFRQGQSTIYVSIAHSSRGSNLLFSAVGKFLKR